MTAPNCRYHPDKEMRLVSSDLPLAYMDRELEWRKEHPDINCAPKIWRCSFPGCAFVEKHNEDENVPTKIVRAKPLPPIKTEDVPAQEIVEVGERVVYFSASNSEEMARAQTGLSTWLSRKIKEVRKDLSEIRQSLKIAKERKWASTPYQRQKVKMEAHQTYYCKLLAAVDAGYVLVPEFPIDIFAVRLNRRWTGWGTDKLESDKLEVADGRYVNADAKKRLVGSGDNSFWRNDEFQEVTFPLVAAKPHVMQATADAMEKKIFDEVGIVSGTSTYGSKRTSTSTNFGDPLIIGVVKMKKFGYYEKRCHFLIAWHVNVEAL